MKRPPSSSFTVKQVNSSTFLIVEHDFYNEHPFIYAKLHPWAPILILNDTGCNRPDAEHERANVVHLRSFLETYPVPELNGRPINPGGALQYVIILSHCHYDHIGGIEQFLNASKTTEIIASAAGRDFIESDLAAHSLCKHLNIPTPSYKVTHWAQSNERLTWPLRKSLPGDNTTAYYEREAVDLGILILHTPGHTPDSLCWYDYDEGTIYVGDTLYLLSEEMEPIYMPPQGDLVDWLFSVPKIFSFIWSLDLTGSSKGTLLSASHTTCNEAAISCLLRARELQDPILKGKPLGSSIRHGEIYDYYLPPVPGDGRLDRCMSILLPRRLVDLAKPWLGRRSYETLLA